MTSRSVPWRVALIALAWSCGHPSATPPPLAPVSRAAALPDACILTPDSSTIPESLSIAVPDVARFVERQVYETLIRVDCAGTIVPELAETWTGEDAGRRWSFTLRPRARFTDSVPVTATDVFATLTRDSLLVDHAAVTLESIDRVSVRFAAGFAGVPPFFADQALAVTRPGAATGLPGSGSVRVDSAAGVVTLLPLVAGARPKVTVRSSTGGDARDLLDHGIDVLVTGDPEALSYAAGRSDLRTVPLPWDRIYVLVAAQAPSIADSVRASLARDVVRTDARPASGHYWWQAGPACPAGDTTTAAPAPSSSSSAVVYYPLNDAPARGLAERLVALGLIGTGGRAAGLSSGEFDARFTAGGGVFLVPLSSEALSPCRAVADLAARAPWLSGDPGRFLTALVETRRRAIVRRGGAALTVDWDGTLRLR